MRVDVTIIIDLVFIANSQIYCNQIHTKNYHSKFIFLQNTIEILKGEEHKILFFLYRYSLSSERLVT
jgi:hypothetical protein